MDQLRTPNFFLAGAPKAGTTSLYYALRQHPDIYMSPMKEPSYFSQELREENFVPALRPRVRAQAAKVRQVLAGGVIPDELAGVVTDWVDYLRLFAGAAGQKAVGEASVCYLWSKIAPGLIAQTFPGARIILVLRNPADRAFSQYRSYAAAEAKPQSFRQHMQESLASSALLSVSNPLLQFGLYAEQVGRYLRTFPQQQVGIWIYEDTLRDPATFLHEVFAFLGVDAKFVPESSNRYKEVQTPRVTGVPRSMLTMARRAGFRELVPQALRPSLKKIFYQPQQAMRMDAEDRAYLVDYYRDDIMRLGSLLERDLTAWLRL